MNPNIFRAYDIRGIVDEDLTPDSAELIGLAIGSEALSRGETSIIVGRDGRLSGEMLLEALTRGLQSAGCDVIDIGQVTSPVVYFATHHCAQTRSGVMVTGSHNPANYNGFKIVLAGQALSGDKIVGLYRRIVDGNFVSGHGKRTLQNVVPDYYQTIVQNIQLSERFKTQRLKIVVDAGNGVAGAIAPPLLERLNCDVVPLYCEVDGRFPNHHPDPTQEKNLTDLIRVVQEQKADIGFAFDGDGDRLGIITPKGHIVWPDQMMMIFARALLEQKPGAKIIFDVKCSQHLPRFIQEHGGIPIMWKTGHSYIKAKLQETNAELAGEMSGHLFFKDRWFGFDDAIYAAARFLEILSNSEEDLDSLFDALPKSHSTPEIKIVIDEQNKFIVMQRLQAELRFDDAEVTTIDGVRANFEEGWGLMRASNTTPNLVLRFEANSQNALDAILVKFKKRIHSIVPELELPF